MPGRTVGAAGGLTTNTSPSAHLPMRASCRSTAQPPTSSRAVTSSAPEPDGRTGTVATVPTARTPGVECSASSHRRALPAQSEPIRW